VDTKALILSAILAAGIIAFPAAGRAAETPGRASPCEPSGQEVRAAILRSVDYLHHKQRQDGSWPDYLLPGGVTALASYALLQAGLPPDDRSLAAPIAATRRLPLDRTYVVALKAMVLGAADRKLYAAEIQACADWLAAHQQGAGGWGYGEPSITEKNMLLAERGLRRVQNEADIQRLFGRSDASNTQFAILGLHEAVRAGASVPAEVWQKADRYLRAMQLPSGGWSYLQSATEAVEPYGSMTAGALASLYICHDHLARQDKPEAAADRLAAIDRAIKWIENHYTLRENPGRGESWYYFWLYSLERAGVLSGRQNFGRHDWFREGAALLVKGQRPDGSWTDGVYQNSLGLLFLVKGYKPVLVQRLTWPGSWREDPRDLDHLVRFLDTRVGGAAVGWQTVSADAPPADLLAAPILHVAGRGPIDLAPAARESLKSYVEQGGFILFDAQGGDAAFAAGVRRLAEELFPGAKFEPLAANHPIVASPHTVRVGGLEALATGCRASVILATQGIADGWAQADPARPDEALRLGENLALYATGTDPLPDRLHAAVIAQVTREDAAPRDATRIGQIQHNGDWQPRPLAIPKLLKNLADKFGVAVYSKPTPVHLTDPDLGKFPVLYMTGHYTFTLTPEEKAALRAYLERGGIVWAEACCGRAAFDKAFRDLAREILPQSPLAELPADHDLYVGKVGVRIEKVAYSDAVRAETPDLARPVLLGAKRGGHLVVIYSPFGLGAGLDDMHIHGARCLAPDDAKRLAANILLYAMTY